MYKPQKKNLIKINLRYSILFAIFIQIVRNISPMFFCQSLYNILYKLSFDKLLSKYLKFEVEVLDNNVIEYRNL